MKSTLTENLHRDELSDHTLIFFGNLENSGLITTWRPLWITSPSKHLGRFQQPTIEDFNFVSSLRKSASNDIATLKEKKREDFGATFTHRKMDMSFVLRISSSIRTDFENI